MLCSIEKNKGKLQGNGWRISLSSQSGCRGPRHFLRRPRLLRRQSAAPPTATKFKRPGLWTARPQADLDDAMSARYGHPVDMSTKLGGLSAIADALNRGDVFRAQLGTLALRLPDPPESASGTDPQRLAALLHGSDMLRRGQNSSPPTHDCRSGTCGSSGGERTTAQQYARDPRVIPAQEFLFSDIPFELPGARPPLLPWDFVRPRPGPIPPDMPRPWQGPLGPEIPLNPPWARPGPIRPDMPRPWQGPAQPDIPEDQPWTKPVPLPPDTIGPVPRELPGYLRKRRPIFENPYPDDPECEEEWDAAYKRCAIYKFQKKFRRGYHGPGRDYLRCLMGQIQGKCGGNAPNKDDPGRGRIRA